MSVIDLILIAILRYFLLNTLSNTADSEKKLLEDAINKP